MSSSCSPSGLTGPDSHVHPSLPRDYVGKNGFSGIVLGLSGGVDSALSAAVAVDALGSDRVLGVRLPSPFTGQVSMEEAQIVADTLGIRLVTIPIAQMMVGAEDTLAPVFEGRPRDVAEENLRREFAVCC